MELDQVDPVGPEPLRLRSMLASSDSGRQSAARPLGVAALGEQVEVAAPPADGLADQLLAAR